ncbi:hypothetical protein TorRG33x02_352440 [Trema orientale]|uniref:Uncharacterized protein n=1 Tax=Trema orientale TaxID=63057 RepID=A0A2P5AEL7_TREOI|nr:hypothetical protein TorRG33x02_352440 [Trema orientale]
MALLLVKEHLRRKSRSGLIIIVRNIPSSRKKIPRRIQKRQMEPSEKAQYGVLSSIEPTHTSGQGKTSTKSGNATTSGKVMRKPLPTMKGSRKVQCRCSTEKVYCVISSMTDGQKSVITNYGFGFFLRMKMPFIKSTLISYLIDRIDTEARMLTIHGNTYSLSRESFKAVMGLLDGGEEIIVYDDMENNPFWDEIVGAYGRIVLSELVIDLQKSKEADELFVIRFILLVIGTVLWPTSGVYVNTNYISLLSNVKRISKKNWASC